MKLLYLPYLQTVLRAWAPPAAYVLRLHVCSVRARACAVCPSSACLRTDCGDPRCCLLLQGGTVWGTRLDTKFFRRGKTGYLWGTKVRSLELAHTHTHIRGDQERGRHITTTPTPDPTPHSHATMPYGIRRPNRGVCDADPHIADMPLCASDYILLSAASVRVCPSVPRDTRQRCY